MKRIRIQFLALILIGVIGCTTGSQVGRQRFKVVGTALEYPVPPTVPPTFGFVCSDLDEIAVRDRSVVRSINIDAGDLIESESIVKLSARQRKAGVFFNYGVLMGPNPLSGTSVSGWFENSDPTIRLASEGWVYLEGEQLRARTTWVSTPARGSAIVLQIVSSTLQRVFFLDGVQVDITRDNCPPIPPLNVVGTYVNIEPACAISAPLLLDVPGTTPPDVQGFIDYVRTAADACGLAP